MCKLSTCIVCCIVDALILTFLAMFLYVMFSTDNEVTRYFNIKTNENRIHDGKLGSQLVYFFKRLFGTA